ncbi:hypothetical protein [Kocuria sp.]|uniref:hypothetical protein n=1 Tax=Kocuria sp. TaxID=1871328 RepID=UPI0026DF55C1|nr:hypothetical protein [Kocuria sp.]MDO5619219.1 hypothetical protein [Kocuria sp.]
MVITSIILALLAAVGLAVGTHLQHHAVRTGSSADTKPLVLRPLWLVGLTLLGLETVLNIAALGLGPVALVQPVGAVSLVVAIAISMKVLRLRMTWPMAGSMVLTLGGVAGFVAVSAHNSQTASLVPGTLTWLNGLLILFSLVGAVLAATGASHLVLVALAGLTFGTVAASVHVVASSVMGAINSGGGLASAFDLVLHGMLLTVIAIVLASAVGIWVVQAAYASGPPETVLAGLTVVDPMMAVFIGAVVLGEYGNLSAAALTGLLLTGAAAVVGVVLLARSHPGLGNAPTQTTTPRAERPAALPRRSSQLQMSVPSR